MEELQAQNKLLRNQNDLLQREITQLNTRLEQANKDYANLVKEYNKSKLSSSHIILDTISYQDEQKPILVMNDFQIQFESPSAKETQLAKIVFQPKNLAKIAKSPISIETIYDWHKYAEDWFDITLEERTIFQKSIYNSFRRLNDKIAPFFHNKKLFIMNDKNWSFNQELKVIPTTPNQL